MENDISEEDALSSPFPKNSGKSFIEDAQNMFDVISPPSGSFLLLPLDVVDVTRAAAPVSVEGSCIPSAQNAISRSDVPKTRVLVVAKSSVSRKALMKVLTKKGYLVHTAEDGVECLRAMDASMLLEGTRYSLVIIYDQTLVSNGPATSLALRANGYKGIICGVTGHTSPQDIINFKHHGANLVLSKPLNVDVMEGILKDFVF
jgi:CheY-like chemotaxis protein